jgi:hypothetical protein
MNSSIQYYSHFTYINYIQKMYNIIQMLLYTLFTQNVHLFTQNVHLFTQNVHLFIQNVQLFTQNVHLQSCMSKIIKGPRVLKLIGFSQGVNFIGN